MKKLSGIIEGTGDMILFILLFLFTPAFGRQNMGLCTIPLVDYVFYAIIIVAYGYMIYTMQEVKSKKKRIVRMAIWYFMMGGLLSLRLPIVEFPDEVVYLLKLWAFIGIAFLLWIIMLLSSHYLAKHNK